MPAASRPSTAKIWVHAARPRTLPAALSPVALGVAVVVSAGHAVHLGVASLTAACAVLIQIGTNFANDYFDFKKGADTDARRGETRATQAGWVRPAQMRAAFIATFALSVTAALGLVARGGWPIVAIGATGIAAGILYTGGPRPLGYLGLGDVLVLVFFGPVAVAGTAYLQTLELSTTALAAGLVPGLLSSAILVVNNLRDRREDAQCGKRTLVVRLGPRFGRWQYAGCLIGAAAVIAGLVATERAAPGALLALAAAPLGLKLTRRIFAEDGAALDPLLGETGRLLVVVTVLFCAGVLW